MTRVSQDARQTVTERGRWRCEYCQTQQIIVVELEVDHIEPLVAGGTSELDHLCLSCTSCNGAKSSYQTGRDPETGQHERLFNPRQDSWHEHFRWNDDFSVLLGLTSIGRATIDRLEINDPERVRFRRRWVEVGLHPPKD
jgi:hypothetical protein